jgi:endoribonuclease Dicer
VEGAPGIVVAAVLVHNIVLAKSTGSSGRYAKIRASEAALKAIENMGVDKFRQKYQCNCMASSRVNTTAEAENIGSAV